MDAASSKPSNQPAVRVVSSATSSITSRTVEISLAEATRRSTTRPAVSVARWISAMPWLVSPTRVRPASALRCTPALAERQGRAPKTRDYIARRTEIDYATYARLRGKLVME